MEKTEKATPYKRNKEREEGHVMHSREITVAACVIAMFGLMYLIFPRYVSQLEGIYKTYLGNVFQAQIERDFSVSAMGGLYSGILGSVLSIMFPILGTALVVGIGGNILQTGFMFTTKPLQPKLSKISILKGFKRMFSISSVVEMLKSLLKCVLMGWIAYTDYRAALPGFAAYMEYSIGTLFVQIMRQIFMTAIKMALVLAILAVFDYAFQWWKFEKDMRMSKQEVKDENKQEYGNPQVRQEQRRRGQRIAKMRMLERVPSADVVITNPTHYAIALHYEDGVDDAPRVVAKGIDYMAQRIKELAKTYDVPMVENRPLAHSLYEMCEVDDIIPEELYQAVADVLVFVMRQNTK